MKNITQIEKQDYSDIEIYGVEPFYTDVLSADDKWVYLKGEFDAEEDRHIDRPCILKILRYDWLTCINSWLDRKAEYFKNWEGAFCGVNGIFYVEDYKYIEDRELSKYIEDDKAEDGVRIEFGIVPVFEIKVSQHCDMEHG